MGMDAPWENEVKEVQEVEEVKERQEKSQANIVARFADHLLYSSTS
jgi:hypothetical protein